eukprot:GEZU01016121.1.p1 GENE.GEZU01016121.1~~GEZU01016121.1.p1  ORF type:complete len:176 (-),score=43.96 GEZU01016121.1:204-731(-)
MDRPLYGDENLKIKRVFLYLGITLITLIALVTVLLCFIFAFIPNPTHPIRYQHVIFAVIIVALLAFDLTLLIWWSRTYYEMDIKFKVIIFFISAIILLACTNAMTYVFGTAYLGDKCKKGEGIYIANGVVRCLPKPISCFADSSQCVIFTSGLPTCLPFNSTTSICGSPPVPDDF